MIRGSNDYFEILTMLKALNAEILALRAVGDNKRFLLISLYDKSE